MINEKTLQQIADAKAAGLIYNVDWKDLKESINRQLSKGFKQVTSVPYLALPQVAGDGSFNRGVHWDIVDAIYYGQGPQIHANMQNKIAKLEKKHADHWMVKAAREYADAVLPIIADANTIKATITKTRKPRETERTTPERTIENTGTCAVCGRNVKLNNLGNIVDHGFRISWQARSGSCYGVSYRPIEISPEGAVSYLAVIRDMLNNAERIVAEFATKYTEDELRYGRQLIEKDERARLNNAESTVRHAGYDVTRFEKIVAEWEATDLPDAAK